jgi:hypothetical protein
VKLPVWRPNLTPEEERDIAYQERNLLALRYAEGWYRDIGNDWPGWSRVLSLANGSMCFHIPDDFEVGTLPEIRPNWDGHTTRQKWESVCLRFKIPVEEEEVHVVVGDAGQYRPGEEIPVRKVDLD